MSEGRELGEWREVVKGEREQRFLTGCAWKSRAVYRLTRNFTEGRVLKEQLERRSDLGRSSPRKGFYHTSLQAWGPPFLRLGSLDLNLFGWI